jgi:hypothetical protein
MPTKYYTIEVYNRRKWSDKYSSQYFTKEEAEERARELYKDDEYYKNYQNVEPIHTCYRIKETIEETLIHELS